MKKKIMISTGGSGGHVIPATIIHKHLKNIFDIFLTIDERGIKFLKKEDYNIKIINTPKININWLLPLNITKLFFLIIKNIIFINKNKITILISTGGYTSLPICAAAKILGLKIFLYEPNMVLGRANSFFLKFSEKIFCYSEKIKKYPEKMLNKIVLIDPLLRKEFYLKGPSENLPIEKKINLLIIGGSQGAKSFDTLIRDTVVYLSKNYDIKVYHQTNSSDFSNLENFYKKNNIESKIFEFNENVLEFISSANLCITRSGASTLSELIFLNVPSLAIPYPFAKDDHQYENALFYKNKNCCWLLNKYEVNKETIINNVINIIENKDDYLFKKENMKKFSYQNEWNKISQILINTINEN